MMTYMDGFDVGDTLGRWMETSHGPGVVRDASVTPYGYGASIKFPQDTASVSGEHFTRLARPLQDGDQTQICGFQLFIDGSPVPTTDPALVWFESGSTDATKDAVLYFGIDGRFKIKDGTGTLLDQTGPGLVHFDTWYFVEFKVTPSAVGVRMNEVEVASAGFATGGSGFEGIWLNRTTSPPGPTQTANMYYDDLYICNGQGSVNNDYIGIGRVQSLMPEGPGSDTDLIPTGSPDNWDNVNDVPIDVTDYNSSATPGDRDLYQMQDLIPTTTDVLGLQAIVIGSANDAAAHIKAALKSGGTVYYDPVVALDSSTSPGSINLREQDPATSAAWTPSNVDALEAGVEIA